ncbi:MAG TPA: NYN domain-containing protein, partial [Dongiaceae bacterium]|nr:NYN domain-containing protein [Dongiaceae bacterium]
MPRSRLWLMDGHNMIFAIHDLQRLQVSGSGEEARQGLAERLERFALERRERVVVVFDGHASASGQRSVQGAHFEIVYARGGAGAADEFIVREARRASEAGLPVAVVTDDVRTLATRLPRGVRHQGVRAFWLEHVEPRPRGDDKPVGGDFSDLERAMLAQAAAQERSRPARNPAPAPSPPRQDPGGTRRLLKRERGRLRQERRLGRRRTGAGR